MSPNPQIGDLIEIGMDQCFQHWAVCVEVNPTRIIHLWKGPGETTTRVRLDELEKVRNGREYRVNNKYDTRYKARDTKDIYNTAYFYYRKQNLEYDLLNNNCEHFATLCRNGIKLSDQTTIANIVGIPKCCLENPGFCAHWTSKGSH